MAADTVDLQPLAPLEVVWCPDAESPGEDLVVTASSATTVGELAEALHASGEGLTVDGRRVRATSTLAEAGLCRGAVLRPGNQDEPPAPAAAVEVVVVGGMIAGHRTRLTAGTWVIGRAPGSDVVVDAPSVSAVHATVHVSPTLAVELEDCGSTNGTRVDGRFTDGRVPVTPDSLVQLGAVQLRIRASADRASVDRSVVLGQLRRDWTAPFNRPPRQLPAQHHTAVRLPVAPGPSQPPARLPWIALSAPLLLAVGMALFYDPRFGAFALLSPIMMLGTWVEDRRRIRRDRRDGSRRLDAELEEFAQQMAREADDRQRVLRRHATWSADAVPLAQGPSPALWERRPGHDDFLLLSVGLGRLPWRPPTSPSPGEPAPQALAVLEQHGWLEDVPVSVAARPGNVVGVAGHAEAVAASVRGLVLQAALAHGPADVGVAVLTDSRRLDEWEWAKWLPHTRSSAAARRLIAASAEDHATVAAAIATDDRAMVVIVDGDDLLEGRDSIARGLLRNERLAAIVTAASVPALPAACTSLLSCGDDQGVARLSQAGGEVVGELLVAGVDLATARTAAQALAGIDDPENTDVAGALPDRVDLLALLHLNEVDAEGLVARWSAPGEPVVPIGVGPSGTVTLDLTRDGPHALIAGTTGSGKSELLRSVIAGLAATLSPDEMTFVLIDYKGGSAFDACAGLPHTVGVVTDLDEHLAPRALRCLDAELKYRERLFRDVGAGDLDTYRSRGGSVVVPRLLVAVDEFATLAAELPDFVNRLVGIAQRGRSLGVHLLLATQRPAGAVNDSIRANTNARIALRVPDAADSTDVIGDPAASRLSRRHAGRAFLRCGPGELTAFQAALVSGRSAERSTALSIEPFPAVAVKNGSRTQPGPSDLQRLVAAATQAHDRLGGHRPRRPWPAPLPDRLALADLRSAEGAGDVIGLVDDPDAQTQHPYTYDPNDGALVLYGTLTGGPTATLTTIAITLAASGAADCYVIDAGAAMLLPLEQLPAVGAVVRAADRQRQERLIRYLDEELTRRREHGRDTTASRPIVLLIDNYGGFAAGLDDLDGLAVLDTVARIVADGPALGIAAVITADRVNAMPAAVASAASRRLLFRLSDPYDAAQFGLRATDVEHLPDGRAIDVGTGRMVQLAAADSVAAEVASIGVAGQASAPPIGELPPVVALTDIVDAATFDGSDWFLPVGVDDHRLRPAGWNLGPGDHALVTGPARSGKSSVLVGIAQTLAKTESSIPVYAVALRRSPLRDCPLLAGLARTPEELTELLQAVAQGGPAVLLVDDADATDDASGQLTRLLAERRDDLWCIAAGRADVLRTQYGHWTAELRRSRTGLALRPNIDLDGDLWHTPLPRRRRGVLPPGRGYLVTEGSCELLQAALP